MVIGKLELRLGGAWTLELMVKVRWMLGWLGLRMIVV